MTIADCNQVIGLFLEKQGLIKIKADKKTWDISSNKELQKIFNVKTSSTISFANNTQALEYLLNQVSMIKDVCVCINMAMGEVCVAITIGGVIDEYSGNIKNYTFCCERTKKLTQKSAALFEVLSTFCGWVLKDNKFRSDIYYELARVGNGVDYSLNTQVIEPIEVKTHCPHCKEDISIMFNDLKPLEITDL